MGLLDLASFQKVAEDKKMTTLRHKDGHEIKILHSALPKIKQEQLKHLKMAKGGDVKLDHMEKGVHHQSAIKENGQSISGIDVRDGKLKEAKKTHKNKLQELKDMPNPKIKGLADGGDVGQSQDDSSADHTTNVIVNPAPGSQPMQSAQASPVAVPNSQDLPNPQLSNGSMSAPGVAQNAQIYNKLTQDIATQKAKADVDYNQQKLQEETRLRDQQQKYAQDLQNHTDDFSKYIQANPVNPRAYQESLGSGQKVATAIGLFLGGINQARGGGNPAMDFLNHQIDRDIAAQQKRTDNQRTVWGAYNDLYGNQTVANNLAKKSMNDIYTNQINLTAAQLGTPQAKANAALWNATKGPENNKLILDSAGNLSALPNNPGGPSIGPQAQNAQPAAPSGNGATSSWNDEEKTANNQVLDPNAVSKLNSLQYGAPKDQANYPEALKQYNAAYTADQNLQKVDGLFDRLSKNTNGISGRLHRGLNPHALGAAGAAIGTGIGALAGAPLFGVGAIPGAAGGATIGGTMGEAAGHLLGAGLNTGENQEYDRDLESLKGMISASLPGRGDNFVQQGIEKFAPTSQDSPQQVVSKREAFKQFIVDHLDKAQLARYNMLKKETNAKR